MRLSSRVRSLETRRYKQGSCPICHGQGRLVFTNETAYAEPSQEPPVGCAGCGKIWHIRIVEAKEPITRSRWTLQQEPCA